MKTNLHRSHHQASANKRQRRNNCHSRSILGNDIYQDSQREENSRTNMARLLGYGLETARDIRRNQNRLEDNLHLQSVEEKMSEEGDRIYKNHCISSTGERTSRKGELRDQKIYSQVYVTSSA